jgi:hypothetical protein
MTPSAGEHRWTVRQESALDLLAVGLGPTEVARRLRNNRATIYRWLEDRNFRDEVYRRREALFGQAMALLRLGVAASANIKVRQALRGDEKAADSLLKLFAPVLREQLLVMGPLDPQQLRLQERLAGDIQGLIESLTQPEGEVETDSEAGAQTHADESQE